MKFYQIPLFLLLAMYACSPRASWDFVQLNYDVSCPDKETEEMVHKYWGPGFTLKKDTTGAILGRENAEGSVAIQMNAQRLVYQDWETEGDCFTTELSGRMLDIWRDLKVADSLIFLKKQRKIGPFTAKGVLVYEAGFGSDPAELWYTTEIPPYWPYVSELPGMMLEYNYLVNGNKVTYRFRDATSLPESPLEWPENDCSWIFPEVFLVNPEVGTIDINDYNFHGFVLEEGSEKVLPYCQVDLFRNDSLYYTSFTDSAGAYNLFVPLKGEVRMVFSSGHVYVPKTVVFDLNLPPTLDAAGGFASEMKISLFKSADPRVRQYLEENPMGKAAYNPETGNFEFDFEYTRQIQEHLKALREGQ